MNIYYTVYM